MRNFSVFFIAMFYNYSVEVFFQERNYSAGGLKLRSGLDWPDRPLMDNFWEAVE
jgi:hypothetical protein